MSYVVVFTSNDSPPATVRTSKPEELVEQTIQRYNARGMWVEPPLLPGYPMEYIVYKDGRRVSSFTVKED